MSGGSNGSHSEDTKKKISDSNKGKKRTIETKQRMSISGKDRQKISEDTRKNMSDASKGRTQTEESRRKHSTPITLDGVEYYSKREAARQLGISNGTLHYRLKHDWYFFLGNL